MQDDPALGVLFLRHSRSCMSTQMNIIYVLQQIYRRVILTDRYVNTLSTSPVWSVHLITPIHPLLKL